MSEVSTKRINKILNELHAHTASTAQANQKYLVPIIATNDDSAKASNRLSISVEHVEEYRYDYKWYTYHHSDDKPSESFSILKIDSIFTTQHLNQVPYKHFIGTINSLVYQDMIRPFIMMIDDKIVSWDRLELVYDSGDTWLIVRGQEYNNYSMSLAKRFKFIILPYRCEFIGNDTDEQFDLHYNAFCEYIQNTSYFKGKRFFVASPTLQTAHAFNGMLFNVGGWAYTQMKLKGLGMLSEDRIDKLRQIPVYKILYNENGDAVDTLSTKFNLFDMDVPTDAVISNYLYGNTLEDYTNFPRLDLTEDGHVSNGGQYSLCITDESVRCKTLEIDDTFIWDLSDVRQLLLRENFLVFRNGVFDDKFTILTSINNVVMLPNPNKDHITIVLLYNSQINDVIRNSDLFFKDYMTEQAKIYFEAMQSSSIISGKDLPNAEDPEEYLIDAHTSEQVIKTVEDYESYESTNSHWNPDTVVLLNQSQKSTKATDFNEIDAHTLDGHIIRGITSYAMDTEIAHVPSVDDYIVYLERYTTPQEEAIDIVSKLMQPLDFTIDKKSTYEENMNKALDAVIDYNPALLNSAYKTFVDQHSFTGDEANASLIYNFMYENRRGIKIPRKLYKDHETYFMLFVNGELDPRYSQTICYANFFFIPVEEDFEFKETDIVEVLYFKNVNNNEIRFYLSDWLLEQMQDHSTNLNFYDIDVFSKWIKSKDLKIFSHYPRDMIHYPTLIQSESEDIAFNISYRDENENLCIKKAGLTHIVSENMKNLIESKGLTIPDEISSAIDNLTIDGYKQILKDNAFIVENGVNIFSQDHRVTRNALVAVSSHKFIYQRLDVDRKAYRIRLDKRFRYCDNPRQYLLFINGRRMRQDSFLITIPKHTLPFNAMYLYTAKFVKPGDRVELFYLPYDMTDINFDEDRRYYFKENGYLQIDKSMLSTPLSKDLYMFFINGKKIPASTIIDVDSHTIRVSIDTTTTHYPMITALSLNSINKVQSYMSDEDEMSVYDKFIQYIKNRSNGYQLLDKLFNSFTQLSDIEDDRIWMNVAKIAILNEVIRDFWVTSGYDYHSQPFVYDYDDNEYFTRDENGNLILTALDGIPEINIKRNDISLLYFYTDPIDLLIEFGREIDKLSFFWEYSQRLNQDEWQILSQSINGIQIPVDDRSWTTYDIPEDGTIYRFIANTGQQIITKTARLTRANGTYWGMVDQEELQYYHRLAMIHHMDELVAVVPKDKKIPSRERLELESGNPAFRVQIEDQNSIVYNLEYGDEYDRPIDLWMDPSLQDIDEDEYLAICLDGRQWPNPQPSNGPEYVVDDVLYSYPMAIIDDDRFMYDLDLIEMHEMNESTVSREWDAFNILNDNLWAATDTRGDMYNLMYAEIWRMMPQPETIYDITDPRYFAITETGRVLPLASGRRSINALSDPSMPLEKHSVLDHLQWDQMVDVSTPKIDLSDYDFDIFDEGFMAIVPSKSITSDNVRLVDEQSGLMSIEPDEFTMTDLSEQTDDPGTMSFGPDTIYEGPMIITDLDNDEQIYGEDWYTVNHSSEQLQYKPGMGSETRWYNLFAEYRFQWRRESDLVLTEHDLLGEIDQNQYIIGMEYEEQPERLPGIMVNDFIINRDGFTAQSNGDEMSNLDADLIFYLTKPDRLSLETIVNLDAEYHEGPVYVQDIAYTTELSAADWYSIYADAPIMVDPHFDFQGTDLDDTDILSGFLYFDLERDEYIMFDPDDAIYTQLYGWAQIKNADLKDCDFLYNKIGAQTTDAVYFDSIELDDPIPEDTELLDDTIFSEVHFSQQAFSDFTGVDLESSEQYEFGSEDFGIDENGDRVFMFDYLDYDDNDRTIDGAFDVEMVPYNGLSTPPIAINMYAPTNVFAIDVTSHRQGTQDLYGLDYESGERYDFSNLGGVDENGNQIHLFNFIEYLDEYGRVEPLEPMTINTDADHMLVDPSHWSFIAKMNDGEQYELSWEPCIYSKSIPLIAEALLINEDELMAYATSISSDGSDWWSQDVIDGSGFNLAGGIMRDLDTGEVFPIDGISTQYDIEYSITGLRFIDVDEAWWDNVFDPTHETYFAIMHDGSGIADGGFDVEWLYKTKTVETQTESYILSMLEGQVYENGSYVKSFFDIEPMTWNTDAVLNQYDVSYEGFEAILHDGSGTIQDLFYIFEPKPEPEKLYNFFNLEDEGYVVYLLDSTNRFSDVGYITTSDRYDPQKHVVLDIDAEWMRVIDHVDRITKERLVYLNNRTAQIRRLPFEFIDDDNMSLVTDIDEQSVKVLPFPNMTWSANERSRVRRNIGFYDFEAQKALIMAINEGTASVVHGLDYSVDGLADNKDVVVYEDNGTIYAMTLDGEPLHDFHYEDHEYSWSNKKLVNIAEDEFMALFDGNGNIARNLFFVYDPNRPEIRHYYDESNLPTLIGNLEKQLIPEPPHVRLKRYVWGNERYFVFACPKRVVYHDWHCQTKFNLPDPTSHEVLSKSFVGSTPLYTNGKKSDQNVMTSLTTAEMEYMGECYFTNQYGYTEPYMVWKSNGFYTRLNADAGLDMTIEIGQSNQYVTFYDRIRESLVNTIDSKELLSA